VPCWTIGGSVAFRDDRVLGYAVLGVYQDRQQNGDEVREHDECAGSLCFAKRGWRRGRPRHFESYQRHGTRELYAMRCRIVEA
jgi:hypothetical protein